MKHSPSAPSQDERETEPATRSTVGRWIFLGLSLLLAGPVLWVSQPPMADLPQHAAQIQILLDWNDPQLDRQATYRLDLFTPYLIAYAPAWLLAHVMPLVWALKLMVAASLIALPWAARRLIARVGGPVELSWLVFPLALSYAYHWGFLNYIVATPLVLLFTELCVWHSENPTTRSATAVALSTLGLFFCHAIVGGLACAVGGGMSLLRRAAAGDLLRRWPAALLPFAAPLPLIGLWAARTQPDLTDFAKFIAWSGFFERLGDLTTWITGWENSLPHLLLGVGLLALPFLLGARPSRQAWRWWPFAACVVLGMVWPDIFLAIARIAGRFAVFLLPFLLFACEPAGLRERRPLPEFVAVMAAVGLLLSQAANTYSWQQQIRPFDDVLAAAEPGHTALTLNFLRGSTYGPSPLTISLPQWYMLEGRSPRVDPSFAMQYPLLVRYHPDQMPELPFALAWNPASYDWRVHTRYDYYFVIAPEDVSARLFPPGAVERVTVMEPYYLYRNSHLDREEDDLEDDG